MSKRNKQSKTILFLYAELAQYFIACVNELADEYDYEIHIVRWEVNAEAPFQFDVSSGVTLHKRSKYSTSELINFAKKIDPDLIFCSGWMDRGYLKVCKMFRDSIPVVVGMDNKWKGTVKQIVARFASRWTVRKWFSHAWVAGEPQKKYALNLGFDESRILKGVYSADYDYFDKQFKETVDDKSENLPHRFLYVGRYIERKGIKELWNAFIKLTEETGTDWELWCCGTGPLEDRRVEHPQIKHLGFVQPEQMKEVIKETSVFILPSHVEPWGVVVHEFAAAGFPLICSDHIGAATQFLKEEKNGYQFSAADMEALKDKMRMIIDKSDSELIEMGRISSELAATNTPSIWAKKMNRIIKSN